MARREATTIVLNHVRARRLATGLSQQQVATRSGLTRQAISAIEAGHYLPNTAVALRLARALGGSVESLFALVPDLVSVPATAVDDAGPPLARGDRLWAAQIGERVCTGRLSGESALRTPADGLATALPGAHQTSLMLELLVGRQHLAQTAVLAGCDPASTLLACHLHRRFPTLHLHWHSCNSRAALAALERGTTHVAGIHLQDPASGTWNLPAIRQVLPGHAVAVVTLATWQAGLLIAPANRKGIRGVADLARADVTSVHREFGSGSQQLLETALARAGITWAQVRSDEHRVFTQLAVGEAVATGLADAGYGLESVARAFGLGFVPLQEERYDLVIPREFLEHPPVQGLLDTIVSAPYRRELAALGGYDTSQTGNVVAELDKATEVLRAND